MMEGGARITVDPEGIFPLNGDIWRRQVKAFERSE